MTPNSSDWTAFDPSSATPPESLAADAAGVPASGLVTFLVDQGVDRDWATDAVLGTVRAWAGAGRKIFLADMNFREPLLHEVFGVENADGISDVFLFGASVRHVARPVDGGFLLATAGTPVSDPATVLRSDRWDTVLAGFRDAGALLVGYVSAGTPGMDSLLGHSDGVVHMSEPDAPALRVEGGILARIGPGAAPVEEVVDVSTLAPDPEPVEPSAPEVATPTEGPTPPDEVVDVASLAPDPADETEEAPAFEAPSFDEPAAEEPVEEAPAFEAPSFDEPADDDAEPPIFDAPSSDAPESSDAMEDSTEDAVGDLELADPEEEPVSETEDEGGAFDFGDLPSADEPVDEAGGDEGGDLFSMDGLEGTQYNVGGSDETPASAPAADEEAAGGGGDFEMADGGLEVEEVESDSSFEMDGGFEVEEPEAEEEPSFDMEGGLEVEELEPEEPGIPSMEVEGSALVDDDDLDSIAASSTMMEGLETGSGFDMPDDDASAPRMAGFGGPEFGDDGPVAAEPEPDDESGDFDFGDGPIELEAQPEPDEPDEVEAPASVEEGSGEDDLTVASAADEFLMPDDEADEDGDEDAPFLDPEAAESGGPEAPAAGGGPGGGGEERDASEDDGSMRVTEERELTGLAKLEKAQKAKARTRTMLIAIVTLLIVGGGGYGLVVMGIVPIAGITPPERMGTSGLEPVTLPGPVPSDPVMSHALITQLYNDIESPWDLANTARANLPTALFYVAPVSDGDRIRWGLFVGPAYSAVEAEALRAPVDSAIGGGRFDESGWTVVDGRYAFFFGEYPTFPEAQSRVDGLLGQEVPTYILEVDYADSSAYRVYGGAYGDPFQAGPFLELLQSRELTDIPLTERRGKRPE